MKIHRSIIHVGLALLLLISQQWGLSHVMAHMNYSRYLSAQNAARLALSADNINKAENTAAQPRPDLLPDLSVDLLADLSPDLLPDLLPDGSCGQCLVFSQLATALPVVDSPTPPVVRASFVAATHNHQSVCSQTRCVYLSRAPPVLA